MSEIIGVPSPGIFQLLAEAKRRIGHVGKGDVNKVQGFKFRGIDAVVNAVAPAFNELGIVTVPEISEHEYDTVVVGKNQTQMGHVRLVVKYHFYGPQGDSVTAMVASESMDSGDKATPKAMSVAYRIALLQVLNLPTDEPDPDSESYERSDVRQFPVRNPRGVSSPRADWAASIAGAGTDDELNGIWKKAGAAGELQKELLMDGGEKITVEKLLHRRHDEIALKSGV